MLVGETDKFVCIGFELGTGILNVCGKSALGLVTGVWAAKPPMDFARRDGAERSEAQRSAVLFAPQAQMRLRRLDDGHWW